MFCQHRGSDHLGVERQLQLRAVEIGEFASGPRRDGRHQVVNGTHPSGECRDRRVVGHVNGLGSDAVVVVLPSQYGRVTPRDDHVGSLRTRQNSNGAGDPAAAPDDHHTLTSQGTHN